MLKYLLSISIFAISFQSYADPVVKPQKSEWVTYGDGVRSVNSYHPGTIKKKGDIYTVENQIRNYHAELSMSDPKYSEIEFTTLNIDCKFKTWQVVRYQLYEGNGYNSYVPAGSGNTKGSWREFADGGTWMKDLSKIICQ